jgi:aryl-alcohol dehydrogenase-like predicted oxidoreductase
VEYQTLGATGITVSRLALGTMMLGAYGNPDHDDAIRIIHAALDGGINFVDTADVYSAGESEEIVGQALAGRRDDVVLATKFALPMGAGPNHSGGSRRYIIRAVEDSLRRLQTDHIDLYQMHRPDPDTDISETLSALSDLVRTGKVRAIGASTFPAELIVEAQWAAERGGHQPFRTEQPRYSILTRTIEAAVLPTAQRYGMGVLTYGPLSSGWLSGRADPANGHRSSGAGAKDFDLSVPANRAKLTAVEQLTKLAADAGLPLAHLATAFVLAHPAVTSVLTGPRTMNHLTAALAGADVRLNEEVLDKIDEIVAPGAEVNPADNYITIPALADKNLRRRRR